MANTRKNTGKTPGIDRKQAQEPVSAPDQCPARVRLKLPVEAAENEIKRIYGVTKTATANVMLAILTERAGARPAGRANKA